MKKPITPFFFLQFFTSVRQISYLVLFICLLTGSLHAQPVCNAYFGHSYNTNNTDSVHFYPAVNPTGSHYSWTFGDGSSSSDQYPWHYYTTSGTYYVCLTV